MTTIRPNVYPQQAPLSGQQEDAAKLAAQRAFFNAAMGQTQAQTPVTATAAAPAEAPKTVNRVAETDPTEAPQRILRPGSLLDIRV